MPGTTSTALPFLQSAPQNRIIGRYSGLIGLQNKYKY